MRRSYYLVSSKQTISNEMYQKSARLAQMGALFGTLLLLAYPFIGLAENTVKIGATLPLTGRLSIAGQDARQGIELAIEDFSTPALRLQALFDDNQHDAKQAVASARKLLDIDKVNVLISMWDMADVVAPLAEQKRIPHLAVRWNPHITEKFRYTFTFESTYRSYVESLILLLKRLERDTIAIIAEEAQGWLLSADYLASKAPESGIRVVSDERFIPDSADYRTAILRAIRDKPEIVILLSNPPHTELLITQLRALAPKQEFTGYFEIVDPNLVEGVPFVAQFEVEKWFVKKFEQRYGIAPRSRAAQVYDMIHLLALSVAKSAEQPTPQGIVNALDDMPGRSGAAGEFVINTPRVIESRCVWKVARKGVYQPYS